MSRSTFKILFYVKKGSERANGYLPLMCRLTVDGEIKQFSCKLDVPPKLWDVKTARATGKSAEAQKINAAVDRIRVDVNRRYQELMQSDGYVTAARLRDACLGLGVKRETLLKLSSSTTGSSSRKWDTAACREHTTATVPYTGTFASSSRKYTAVTTSP